MACDGDYLYTYSEYGFHKIGTGFGGTVSGHPYVHVARTSSLTLHSSDVCLGFYQVSTKCLFYYINMHFYFLGFLFLENIILKGLLCKPDLQSRN